MKGRCCGCSNKPIRQSAALPSRSKASNKTLLGAASAAQTFAAAFGAGFATAGLAQLPGMLRNVVAEIADLGDLADRVGLTAEQIQELNFQAQQTGSSAETMASGLETFGKRLAEARAGSGELYKLLKANGVALDELAKMDINEALAVFVDLIGNAADGADALAVSAEGFGRGAGAELALTFAGGTKAMGEFATQARDTISIISDFDVKKIQDIDDAWDQWNQNDFNLDQTQRRQIFEQHGARIRRDRRRLAASERPRTVSRRRCQTARRGSDGRTYSDADRPGFCGIERRRRAIGGAAEKALNCSWRRYFARRPDDPAGSGRRTG